MWYRRFSWQHISALCSGEDDKDILVDREACGEVSSKRGKEVFFGTLTKVLPSSCLLRHYPVSLQVAGALWRDRFRGKHPRIGKTAA